MNKRVWQIACGLLFGAGVVLAAPAALADDFVGLVYPEQELALSLGQGGIISEIRVKPGQSVKANQVLLVLDDRMQQLEMNRRKVVWDDKSELTATRDRVRVLKGLYEASKKVFDETGSVSRDELSRLEVEYSAARARVEQLEAQEDRERLEYQSALQDVNMRRLNAPVAGVITRVQPKVGEWAKPGDLMMELVDPASCYLKVNVPLKFAQGVHAGMRMPVRLETGGAASSINGRVSFVSAVADPASGLVEMRIAFANGKRLVRPGAKGSVSLSGGKALAAH
jgi:RND family efflux transporter MFP subunit